MRAGSIMAVRGEADYPAGIGSCGPSTSGTCTIARWRGVKNGWPALRTEKEAEWFVAEANLSECSSSAMVPDRFEPRRKHKV
jgi:hypothetical protein